MTRTSGGDELATAEDLDARLLAHRKGRGARLIEVISAEGTGFVVARTWDGDRHLERGLKNRKSSPRLCPLCISARRRPDGCDAVR